MSESFVLVETRGRVGWLTLNRPKALNALNDQLMEELGAALLALDADDGIGAIVITGSEKAFAAGADIGAMKDWSYMDVYRSDIEAMTVASVMMAKECINRAYEVPLNDGLLFERRVFHSLFATEDQKEGMAAFTEKRKPDFKHR